MARISWAGFETGSLQEMRGPNSAASVVAGGRTGSYSCRLLGGNITAGNIADIFTADKDEIFWRCAIRIDTDAMPGDSGINFMNSAAGYICALLYKGSAQQLCWVIGSPYTENPAVDWGVTVLRPDIWYVLEGHIKVSTGLFVVKINGVTDISSTGNSLGASGIRRWGVFGGLGASGGTVDIDDLAVNDTAGSFQNDYPGLGGIFFLKANGDGTVQEFTPSAGTDHYALVDDVPANTTDYVYGQASGDQELFHVENTPEYITQINVVQPAYQAAISVSGSNQLRDIVRDGSTIYSGDDTNTVVSIAPAYVLYRGKQYYEQPDGVSGAFDSTALDAFQIGVEIP